MGNCLCKSNARGDDEHVEEQELQPYPSPGAKTPGSPGGGIPIAAGPIPLPPALELAEFIFDGARETEVGSSCDWNSRVDAARVAGGPGASARADVERELMRLNQIKEAKMGLSMPDEGNAAATRLASPSSLGGSSHRRTGSTRRSASTDASSTPLAVQALEADAETQALEAQGAAHLAAYKSALDLAHLPEAKHNDADPPLTPEQRRAIHALNFLWAENSIEGATHMFSASSSSSAASSTAQTNASSTEASSEASNAAALSSSSSVPSSPSLLNDRTIASAAAPSSSSSRRAVRFDHSTLLPPRYSFSPLSDRTHWLDHAALLFTFLQLDASVERQRVQAVAAVQDFQKKLDNPQVGSSAKLPQLIAAYQRLKLATTELHAKFARMKRVQLRMAALSPAPIQPRQLKKHIVPAPLVDPLSGEIMRVLAKATAEEERRRRQLSSASPAATAADKDKAAPVASPAASSGASASEEKGPEPEGKARSASADSGETDCLDELEMADALANYHPKRRDTAPPQREDIEDGGEDDEDVSPEAGSVAPAQVTVQVSSDASTSPPAPTELVSASPAFALLLQASHVRRHLVGLRSHALERASEVRLSRLSEQSANAFFMRLAIALTVALASIEWAQYLVKLEEELQP